MSIFRRSTDLCILASRRIVRNTPIYGDVDVEAVTCWMATDPVPTIIVATALLVKSKKTNLWVLNHLHVLPEFRRRDYASQILDQLVLLHGLENIGACWATPEGAKFAAAWKYKRSIDVPWWQIITDAEELEPPEPPETAGRIGT